MSYYKTLNGVISAIYNKQKTASKQRGHSPPEYTKAQLTKWLYKNGYYAMWCQWVNSGYDKDIKPSVDRLDDTQGYSLKRIQLVTWDDNNKKGTEDIKSGKLITSQMTKVDHINNKGEVIKTYHSMTHASRETGCMQPAIWKCCNGQRNHTKGFKWQYSN